MKHIYIIKKYIAADSISDAIKKEKKGVVSEVYLDNKSYDRHIEKLIPVVPLKGFHKR